MESSTKWLREKGIKEQLDEVSRDGLERGEQERVRAREGENKRES